MNFASAYDAENSRLLIPSPGVYDLSSLKKITVGDWKEPKVLFSEERIGIYYFTIQVIPEDKDTIVNGIWNMSAETINKDSIGCHGWFKQTRESDVPISPGNFLTCFCNEGKSAQIIYMLAKMSVSSEEI
ncbi:MAG: hypothetical protein F6K54_16240 [Okeania sp. SIO3B5]|uniref:hypothetical protein n=1 Tax=Okeania sp. SIO3B5 TaxID=2607811 RepID=UPI001400DF1B|nr:hypothetical protein [Okeania sp. SIO3B5]NEO54494.1 hypothetical protein [Okeania sp. SIO3B5]